MNSIPSAKNRLKICNNAGKFCQDANNRQNLLNKNKNVITNHFWNAIKEWININDYKSPLAIQNQLSLPIVKIIDSDVLAAWKAELQALGYTVTISDSIFKVEI